MRTLLKTLFLPTMKLRIFSFAMIVYLMMFQIQVTAQTTLLATDFSTGIPAEWSIFDQDGLTPEASVSEFTEAWISYIDEDDTAAASTSYYQEDGPAADYIVTPRISLGNFSRLIWTARSVDASYPDGYQVLISTTDSLPGSFTDTLFTTFNESPYYTTRSIELDTAGYANQDVFIAIRNTTTGGFILLLDQLTILGAETATLPVQSNDITVSLYPNPVKDQLNVSSESTINAVLIYSLQGQIMLETKETDLIDLQNLPAGVYQVLVQTAAGTVRKKIIKY